MDASVFRALFLALFGLGLAVEWALNRLNRREALRHPSLPARFSAPPFAGLFDAMGSTYAKARAYTLDRLAFDSFSAFWSAAITLLLLFTGILPWIDRLLARALPDASGHGLHHGVLFLAGVTLATSLLKLPLTAYATFRLEGRYGFNTMTWGLFRRDLLQGAALSAVIGIPLLYAVLALMRLFGPVWWAWAFGLLIAFQIVMLMVYPIFIAPLFNRFKPLEDGDLKRSLLALAGRLRFPAGGIYVMDGSRRSLHSNAYFTGFGRFRRIVFFDTLLRQMEPPELVGVLAHEIGHYKLNHIYKLMAVQVLSLGALLWLAAQALRWPPLYVAFGFDAAPLAGRAAMASGAFAGSPAVGLFLFMTAVSTLSILFAPVRNRLSRRHEYEADAFAVRALGESAPMQTALIKLSTENLSNLTPHPWYSAFHYSHPTLAERLEAIGRLRSPASFRG